MVVALLCACGEGDGTDRAPETSAGSDTDVATVCAPPQAPALTVIDQGTILTFRALAEGTVEIGRGEPGDVAPETWRVGISTSLDAAEQVQVFARFKGDGCEPQPFSHVYDVRAAFPPAAGEPESTAIAMDDPAIVSWATAVASVNYGAEVEEMFRTPDKAIGPALGTSLDVVALGRGGDITLAFEPPIANGDGYDFTVFENAFDEGFLELAFVEVSTDGVSFLRFDSAYLGEVGVGSFETHETTLIGSLAGKYVQGFGTPFDLTALANRPEAQDGRVDLDHIAFIRIVDVVGDGATTDSFGRAIYDPYPTSGSAGFDLEAIGVLHQR
ncbi:MAG: hypothetical protein AAF654_10205 [Myxococcota bacterium]